MGKFIIEGGHRLSGRVKVQGAKNAALPVLAAAVMSRGEMTLFNCPEIRDVHNMLSILRELGVESYYDGDALKISGRNARSSPMPQRLSKELRSSIFMLGPLLSRFGEAVCAYPGGCEIGHRPVDLHLKGLAALGADIREERGYIICDGHNMHGGEIHLDYPSVGATENIMMAAAAVPDDTVITNSAREPEIEELAEFPQLNRRRYPWRRHIYHIHKRWNGRSAGSCAQNNARQDSCGNAHVRRGDGRRRSGAYRRVPGAHRQPHIKATRGRVSYKLRQGYAGDTGKGTA